MRFKEDEKMEEFLELKTTRKGDIGEAFIDSRFELKGWRVETPPPGSHTFDRKYHKGDKTLYVEIKTYPRLNKYPNATGIDLRDYKTYKRLGENGKNILIIWVDQKRGYAYGNHINTLVKSHPKTLEGRTYEKKIFCLFDMLTFCKLPEELVIQLNEFDKGHYYENVNGWLY